MRRITMVAAGGAAGAAARAVVADLLATPGGLPLATLLVNLAGAFVLGVLVGRLPADPSRRSVPRALIGVGFLGALTTFSTFALHLVTLPAALAVAYGALTLAGGLALARAGLALGERA